MELAEQTAEKKVNTENCFLGSSGMRKRQTRGSRCSFVLRPIFFLVLLSCLVLLSGCRGMELENKTEQVAGYTKAQAMIVLANERNRYQNIYTPEIWDARLGDSDEPFSKYMVQNVKQFLEQVKTLNLLAAERGITATSRERDAVRTLSEQFYSGLSEADRAYVGCSLEDVQNLYMDYFIADKTAASLTAGAADELSDSEVKIIHVQQIVTASEKKATAFLKMVKIDGDDFSLMARRYSESDEVERELSRGSTENLYEKTAFSLEEGQISNIVEMDGLYYIIKCTDGYDEEATLLRKESLQTALLDRQFLSVYEPYRKEHTVKFTENFWNRIDFSEGTDCRYTNFFDLYREAFPDEKA